MNSIPQMTDELGKGWTQPDREQIDFSEGAAKLSRAAFEKLLDYSYSIPSALYPGKMWKSYHFGVKLWFLSWVERETETPGDFVVCNRVICLTDGVTAGVAGSEDKLPVWML